MESRKQCGNLKHLAFRVIILRSSDVVSLLGQMGMASKAQLEWKGISGFFIYEQRLLFVLSILSSDKEHSPVDKSRLTIRRKVQLCVTD